MENKKKDGRVDQVDVIIGQRLFRKRCLLGYSQKDLAEYAGVSIQQIQKYEKSTNRIAGGRLYRFAKLLKVPVEYFFENLDDILDGRSKKAASFAEDQAIFTPKASEQDVITSEKEIITLVRFYNSIKDKNVRKRFLELIRAVSGINSYV
ncbi:helix-turn-helix domain-containing protein [Candidatus Sneabacter namystus]|uniref:Helix-turn-helix domain-containing protein n=1 Tax=Candidatus Sneabacter namystus TaxID=2601646 RepID=A0A5C0UIW5_9RICK|nr:helix-turn-helix domain-containing protein [Candidatus Sneabacter namystus]QEK39382.1 helix-turn-helix domain-containing protein [Candidatus Sneabacter namystus]